MNTNANMNTNTMNNNIIQHVAINVHTVVVPPKLTLVNPDPNPNPNPNPNPPYNFKLFDNPNLTFATLNIGIADTPMINHEQIIEFNVDISGSMGDTCRDGKSKMTHASHTLKNIAKVLSESNTSSGSNVSLAIYGFDNCVDEIIPLTKITPENINDIRCLLDNKLQPRNGTDIHMALQKSNQRLAARNISNPGLLQTHILMTDGQTNEGITDYNIIANEINENSTHILIGLGSDHDAINLQKLAANQKGKHLGKSSSYYYIDAIEKAGLALGEIIHSILYPALTCVNIRVENGEIYDYVTNTWSNILSIPTMLSESNKTFHLRSETPDQISVNISAINPFNGEQILCDDNTPVPDLLTLDGVRQYVDLTKYMHRQHSQELVFLAHQLTLDTNSSNDGSLFTHSQPHPPTFKIALEDYKTHSKAEKHRNLKKNLKSYLQFLKTFMEKNHLKEDDFYNTIYNDISITLQTFGREKAAMYSGARCHSQGRQASYNVSQVDDEDEDDHRIMSHLMTPKKPCRLTRQNAIQMFTGVDDDDDNDDDNDDENNENNNDDYDDDDDDENNDNNDVDNDNLYKYIKPPVLSRTNTTGKQFSLMRDITEDQNISELLNATATDNTDKIKEYWRGVEIEMEPEL